MLSLLFVTVVIQAERKEVEDGTWQTLASEEVEKGSFMSISVSIALSPSPFMTSGLLNPYKLEEPIFLRVSDFFYHIIIESVGNVIETL